MSKKTDEIKLEKKLLKIVKHIEYVISGMIDDYQSKFEVDSKGRMLMNLKNVNLQYDLTNKIKEKLAVMTMAFRDILDIAKIDEIKKLALDFAKNKKEIK